MKAFWRYAVITIFLIGVFLISLVGTSTSMTFVWPGYFALGVAGALAIGAVFRPLPFTVPQWTLVAVFVFAFYLLMRAANSPVAYFAREDAALVIACFLAYAGVLSLCATGQRRRVLAMLLASLVSLNLLFAVLQTFFGPEIWLIPGYERTSTGGVGGLFNQPDHYAAFLAAATPLWISLAVFGRDSRPIRKLWGLLALVSIAAVLLTGSVAGGLTLAAGMATFAIGFVFLLWKRLKPSVQRKALAGFGLCVLLSGAVLYIASDSVSKKLGHGLLTKDGEASLPLMWETGMRQLKESPLIGTGSRSSYIYGRSFRSDELSSGVGETEFVHNEYLQMLGDYGLLGLLFLLVVLAFHFRGGISFVRAYREVKPPPGQLLPHSDHLAMTMGALAAIGSLLIMSGFDFAMHLPCFALFATVLLAVLAAPDPMANALETEKIPPILPGGGALFATRAVAFGSGVAMTIFGLMFSQSEYHYEKARLSFEQDSSNFRIHRHLKIARKLDPQNPFALSLSAHAQVAGMTTEMPAPARRQALEKADQYFSEARSLYPQDVFAAVGHSAVLDELGKKSQAGARLREARQWAPLYGNLMQAEAEHYLRYGEIAKAEIAFRESMAAAAFRNSGAAEQGLKTISEWKFIAQQNGIPWQKGVGPDPVTEETQRGILDAKIDDRSVAGEAIPEPEAFELEPVPEK